MELDYGQGLVVDCLVMGISLLRGSGLDPRCHPRIFLIAFPNYSILPCVMNNTQL